MIIGIEAQRIFRKNKHGMDYVVLQEIKELQQMDKENEYYVFVKPGEDRCVESSANVHVVELNCPSYPLWEQWAYTTSSSSNHATNRTNHFTRTSDGSTDAGTYHVFLTSAGESSLCRTSRWKISSISSTFLANAWL